MKRSLCKWIKADVIGNKMYRPLCRYYTGIFNKVPKVCPYCERKTKKEK